MKLFVAFLLPAVALGVFSAPAQADKAAYCQAYARDFADRTALDKPAWDHKYKIAQEACLSEAPSLPTSAEVLSPKPVAAPKTVAAAAPKPVAASAPKPVAVAIAKPVVVEKVLPVVQMPAPAKVAVAAKAADITPKLVPGTQAWNNYCTKKYTSFEAKTGMYLSHQGMKRRCLVTKDFVG